MEIDKLGPRSNKCLFIGYPKESKGYFFYLPEEQKLFVRLRAIFLEKEFLSKGTIDSKIELNEVQQEEEPIHIHTAIEPNLIRSNPKPIMQPSRRSDRVPHSSDRYYGYLMAILLSSMKIMRIRSPIWMQCKGLIQSYDLEP